MPFAVPHLPHSVLIAIFRHLDARQVLSCSQVSKAWLEAARSEVVWAGLSAVEFGGVLPSIHGVPAAGSSPTFSTLQAHLRVRAVPTREIVTSAACLVLDTPDQQPLQEPSRTTDAVLLTHAQHTARLAALKQRIRSWKVSLLNCIRMEEELFPAHHAVWTAQGVSLYFSTFRQPWPARGALLVCCQPNSSLPLAQLLVPRFRLTVSRLVGSCALA